MQSDRTVLFVVGARPNFVKAAPVLDELGRRAGVGVRLLHTGQHYDHELSASFIDRLGIRPPDHHLGAGSGTHGEQTAKVLVGVEETLAREPPAALVVAGDVNSTMAAALAGAKAGVPVVHIESGLRSRDWTMPEEINRVVTDRVSDLLLCHSEDAVENLAAEGIAGTAVRMVGNTMIDSLLRLLDSVEPAEVLARYRVEEGEFVLVTLHRPALVDDAERLAAVVRVLEKVGERVPVVFPLHPRTRERLEAGGIEFSAGLTALDALDYLDFVVLEASARLVVTDSGGVQEETSALGVPCLTYRTSTERPVTCRLGTNRLVGLEPAALAAAAEEELAAALSSEPAAIPLWDGRAGPRAADAIMSILGEPAV